MIAGPYRAPWAPPPTCARHGEVADASCSDCGGEACDACLVAVAGDVRCARCALARRLRAALRRCLATAGLTAALAAPLAGLFAMDHTRPPSAYDEFVVLHCSKDVVPRMVDHYLSHRVAQACDLAARYGDRCDTGPYTEQLRAIEARWCRR